MTIVTGRETAGPVLSYLNMTDPTAFFLNLPGRRVTVPLNEKFQEAAATWEGIVRNRARWTSDPIAFDELARRILNQIGDFGLTEEDVVAMAEVLLVEVESVAQSMERLGFAGASVPWEHIITSATRYLRDQRPLCVIRHLAPRRELVPREPQKMLVVINGAGELSEHYSFDSEARLVGNALDQEPIPLRNPTLARLQDKIRSEEPDIIHVTGVDVHQGSRLLRVPDPLPADQEGVYLADDRDQPLHVDAETLAQALNAGARKPMFVGLNFYNSSQIAARTVQYGTDAATGFRDTFDDRVAEVFFAEFYRYLRAYQGRASSAFDWTWRRTRMASPEIAGSAVVLWSADSIVPAVVDGPKKPRRRKAAPAEPIASTEPAPFSAAAPPPVIATPNRAPVVRCEAVVKERRTVNYSLLHNRRGLFEKFELKKYVEEKLPNVLVDVTLFVGDTKYQWTRTITLDETVTNLNPQIHVPLTWISNLHLHEGVLTNITARVQLGTEIIHDQPYQVTLLPVDEWTDDDVNRQWLPSFVLPRDPAVSQIIATAEKLLPALADRSSASFDGYQSIDINADDPFAGVDTQAQAIWAALALETPLRYVNPPPTVTKFSQRVRTPSQVMGGSRGTCIDLALLLASCFEFVEIYPALFLLSGHAFVGYWRSDAKHRDFLKLSSDPDPSPDEVPWMIHSPGYDAVMTQICSGALVPLEATLLTQRGGFTDAIEEGYLNLRNSADFEAFLDVMIAREREVRPLPIADFL